MKPFLAGLILSLTMAGLATCKPAPLPSPDVLTPADHGQLQCYNPDRTARTCQSLAGYVRKADGGIDNSSWVMVSKSPMIIMASTTSVAIKNDAVCGSIKASDIAAADFTYDGQPLDAAKTAVMRQQVSKNIKGLIGKVICTHYAPTAGGMTAEATVDGVRQTAMDQPVIWVAPADGYRVGLAPGN